METAKFFVFTKKHGLSCPPPHLLTGYDCTCYIYARYRIWNGTEDLQQHDGGNPLSGAAGFTLATELL